MSKSKAEKEKKPEQEILEEQLHEEPVEEQVEEVSQEEILSHKVEELEKVNAELSFLFFTISSLSGFIIVKAYYFLFTEGFMIN